MLDNIKKLINQLNINDKLILIQEICLSIENSLEEFELSSHQKEEIVRRDKELDINENVGRNWKEIREEISIKYK